VKMLARLLPVLILPAAVLGGAVAGDWLRGGQAPAAPAAAGDAAEGIAYAPAPAGSASGNHAAADGPSGDSAYLKFPQQFFVPIVRGGKLDAVMILDIALEVPGDTSESVFRQESRLRDALLRALLIHANSGGFDGNFTADAHVELLREKLLTAAQAASGQAIGRVLIGDITRQEQ